MAKPNQLLSVSVIIPVFNEESRLNNCLKSIDNQTVKPLEVLVVDNNSTDKTVQVAKRYKFVAVLTEERQGIVWARDAGFNAAKGQIFARLDADTVLPKDWVERVEKHFVKHPNTAITGGGYFYNVALPKFNGWVLGQIAYRMNRLIMRHYILWGSNMAISKQMWQKAKHLVCNRTDIHEDLDLAIHLHRHGTRIAYRESLRVGVEMKRVFSMRPRRMWYYLMLWPQTLKVHGNRGWPVGWIGAALLYILIPLMWVGHYLSGGTRKTKSNVPTTSP